MTYKEKKHFVNESLKDLFPEHEFYVDRDMLDFAFQHLGHEGVALKELENLEGETE